MEILYLWIDNYRSIKKQGFNFGSKYKFHFDQETGILSCAENEDHLENFWGDQIKNVTAIIGKNGSGKSTLLDFIKLNISVDIGNTNLRYLCLFRELGRKEILIYNSIRKEIVLPKGKENEFVFCKRGTIDGKLVSLTYPTAFVFYSPVLDMNSHTEYTPIDISTTQLLRDDGEYEHEYSRDAIDELKQKEMRIQLQFASENQAVLPFGIPEELHMNPNPLKEESLIKLYSNASSDIAGPLHKINEAIGKDLYDKRGEMEQQYAEIYSSIFWHSIQYLLRKEPKIEFSFLDELPYEQSENYCWDVLKELYTNRIAEKNLPAWGQVNNFIQQLRAMEGKEMYYFFARFNFELKQQGNYPVIDSFVKAYYSLSIIGDFLSFYWSGLSSGEQSLFAIFARFHSLRPRITAYKDQINDYRTNVHGMTLFKSTPDVVILLDEAESHLHPQWQKDFIYTITNHLPNVIGSSKVQIILASNSPFLVSDLPHYNVIFLDSIDGNTIVSNAQTTTFASNIHELLAQNFFLDSTIGKVAEEKLNEIIGWLNQKQKLTDGRIEYIHKLIRLIDDPFVQNKLLQMLALQTQGENWEEYQLEQQRNLIDKKLKQIKTNRGNAQN